MQAFGTGWLERIIRARFQVAGPQPFPVDLDPRAQVSMEARPSMPWEYGNARWFRVSGGLNIGAGGAGTFASVRVSVIAAAQRALILTRFDVFSAGANLFQLYLDGAFTNPTTGFGLLDTRYKTAGNSFPPVVDAGLIGQNAAVALPAAGTLAGQLRAAANGSAPFCTPNEPGVLLPGMVFDVFNATANQDIGCIAQGYLVPLEDIGT